MLGSHYDPRDPHPHPHPDATPLGPSGGYCKASYAALEVVESIKKKHVHPHEEKSSPVNKKSERIENKA